MIDLHTHTTASDGRCTPEELVERAAAAGVTVLAVTDHDTVAGTSRTAAACARAGIEFVPGIEITAIVDGGDVHVLGYFIDGDSLALRSFLAEQRQHRVDRIRQMVDRLAGHGMVLDGDAIVAPAIANPSVSIGRPSVARALVAAGHVVSIDEAFGKWLGHGCPGFLPRMGAHPDEVFDRIHKAGGIASLAHPVLVGHDEWIPGFAAAELDALEAYHSDHDAAATERYLRMADDLGLAVSGGSDYHADEAHGPGRPGSVSLPAERFDALKARRVRSV
jgi:predicted metal-dependent phosphoesterase TrpH